MDGLARHHGGTAGACVGYSNWRRLRWARARRAASGFSLVRGHTYEICAPAPVFPSDAG